MKWAGGILLAMLLGCSSPSPNTVPELPLCTPGLVRPCPCGQDNGAQTCDAQGTYGACMCPDASSDAGTPDSSAALDASEAGPVPDASPDAPASPFNRPCDFKTPCGYVGTDGGPVALQCWADHTSTSPQDEYAHCTLGCAYPAAYAACKELGGQCQLENGASNIVVCAGP